MNFIFVWQFIIDIGWGIFFVCVEVFVEVVYWIVWGFCTILGWDELDGVVEMWRVSVVWILYVVWEWNAYPGISSGRIKSKCKTPPQLRDKIIWGNKLHIVQKCKIWMVLYGYTTRIYQDKINQCYWWIVIVKM